MATYLCCLLINMEYGILIGAQVHLLLLAYEASKSKSFVTRYKVLTLYLTIQMKVITKRLTSYLTGCG